MLVSLDVYRPAAQEQLKLLAEANGIQCLPVVEKQQPIDITKRALNAANLNGSDVIIFDTAGRTQIDLPMMSEIKQIKDITKPAETILVADSLTGQIAVNVAKEFDTAVNLSGIILTRVDGDARGGAALSMKQVTGKPIKFIGVGEKITDLELFHPDRLANRILGMGDVVTLVEKAQQDLSEAIERVVAGLEKKSRVLQDDEKKVVAYHEVGHAIVGHLMPGGSKVAKISIVPRGMSALGYTLQLPTEERFLNSKEELKGQIATLLGGRSAEEVVFGKITTGASNDLQRATDIAEQMVGTFGMSDILGPLAYDKQGGGQFLGNGNNPRRSVSDATAQAIDKEVRDLVDDAHETALNILRNNLPLLESISQKILQEEVIEGEDLKTLLAESKMPA